tara:strand:+ start:1482 stop:2936 length:1455 start_codon:yes stop_codon:yes gene_type:complete
MFIPEVKNNDAPLEQKSSGSYGTQISFPEFLANSGNYDLSAYASIRLYEEAMPLFNAIDMRAEAFSQIPIRLYDKSKKEFVDSHPVLDLLAAPNADTSQMELLHGFASFYDITGDAFLAATGRVNNPPLELIGVSPSHTAFGAASNSWGIMNVSNYIEITNNQFTNKKFLAEDDAGRLRYINQAQNMELWHSRTFNPRKSSGVFRGMSRAKPLWYEIQEYIAGNKNNLSMLKRGTRLSMAWVNTGDTELSPTQYERMQQEAQKYSGDTNAGGTPILDGMDVKTIQQTNRDMEFGKLQDSMLARISNTYRIPLALLLDSTMSYNNLETSIVQLYDTSVLPLAKRLYCELTRFLLPRYKNSENLEFRYNENDIPAVRARIIDTTKRQQEVGVNTVDELRDLLGDEPLGGEADNVFISSTMVPLTMAATPTPEQPANPPEEEIEEERSSFDIFYSTLSKALDDDGNRVYSESEIIDIATRKGLLNGD